MVRVRWAMIIGHWGWPTGESHGEGNLEGGTLRGFIFSGLVLPGILVQPSSPATIASFVCLDMSKKSHQACCCGKSWCKNAAKQGVAPHFPSETCGKCWLTFPKGAPTMRLWLAACDHEGDIGSEIARTSALKEKNRPRLEACAPGTSSAAPPLPPPDPPPPSLCHFSLSLPLACGDPTGQMW
jgi:hypothetical protein